MHSKIKYESGFNPFKKLTAGFRFNSFLLNKRPHDWQKYPSVMVCDPDLKASRLWGRLHNVR